MEPPKTCLYVPEENTAEQRSLGSDKGYRRRPIGKFMNELLAGAICGLFCRGAPDWLNRNGGDRNQRDRLYNLVRCIAKGAAFVVNLSERMRVHDLNEAGEQDERYAEDAEPSGPGPLQAPLFRRNTHAC